MLSATSTRKKLSRILSVTTATRREKGEKQPNTCPSFMSAMNSSTFLSLFFFTLAFSPFSCFFFLSLFRAEMALMMACDIAKEFYESEIVNKCRMKITFS